VCPPERLVFDGVPGAVAFDRASGASRAEPRTFGSGEARTLIRSYAREAALPRPNS
jgi:hypothetical protein